MKAKILTMMVTSLISLSSMAVTIDYRHEMNDTAKNDHKDRLLMSHRFDNGFGLSMEGKWGQSGSDKTPNKPFNETVSNGTEVTASYLYKFDKTFGLEGGLNMVSTSNNNNYRPYIKGSVNITDSLYYALRYRASYLRNSNNIGNPNSATNPTSIKGYTITSTLGYKLPANFVVEYEFEYDKKTKAGSVGYIADNDNYGLTHNVKLAYKVDKNWTPYAEVGNVVGSTTTDERQTRYRVGVQYNF
ncbi:oligogalacturonate-specific porin KdgM family protein [Pectobacterium aroidearum]|uniref:oligogalacturonate-specific porin KdgM family protein n=1 Tax=Pectobacterium aroidearum TaxID=1201031 RepID=UPI002114A115|nr:oligogalacturonate-specific porin KdgM family protein [Pectobacterium aroidearum]UUE59557.1 oligogalacturonate-specific porin KdgM family protein [Pectobacterium aroidearum]UUE72385.1 oligogalacturonate-specific porin KdgM family protein [Pectobacterium aroidearum]UUE76785.1 oligogalacturonate-specific porin KdgM family protein [Pectobacterium aroidearum]UUE81009.1 oligogalacturonate-specific porin KdgM family protein [Pectobacterium aroidearum]